MAGARAQWAEDKLPGINRLAIQDTDIQPVMGQLFQDGLIAQAMEFKTQLRLLF